MNIMVYNAFNQSKNSSFDYKNSSKIQNKRNNYATFALILLGVTGYKYNNEIKTAVLNNPIYQEYLSPQIEQKNNTVYTNPQLFTTRRLQGNNQAQKIFLLDSQTIKDIIHEAREKKKTSIEDLAKF